VIHILKQLLLVTFAAIILSACKTTAPTTTTPQPEQMPQEDGGPPLPANQGVGIPATETDEIKPTHTMADVALHTTPNDCWIVYNTKVYDISGVAGAGFPGGEAVYQSCGQDATTLLDTSLMAPGTPEAQTGTTLLSNLYIGDLALE
jgi:hypothetical protein